MDYTKLSILELKELLDNKQVSATELVKQSLNKIEETKHLNTMITLLDEYATSKAEQVDSALSRGESIGVLAGVPISIKDNINLKNFKTTSASKYLSNYVSPYSATVVEKLEAAGAIIVGKNNLDDMAMGSSTEFSSFGVTQNPINTEYVPGGSSGGSTASVASNQVFASIGTDTGGSIRQPASFCGVVGLKPTYGTVSRFGLVAFASSLDQAGPITKTVKDNALIYSVIAGKDINDSTTTNVKEVDYLSEIDNFEVKNFKIGVIKELKDIKVSDQVRKDFEDAIDFYKKQGAEIVEVSVENILNALSCYHIISSAEAASNLARFDGVKYGVRGQGYEGITDLYFKTRTQGFGEEVKKRIMFGNFVLSEENFDSYFNKSKMIQSKITEQLENALSQCDVILTPTTTRASFKLGENSNDTLQMYQSDIFTVPASLSGLPAITIPSKKQLDKDSLPTGLQFIGKRYAESTLFGIANFYEQNAFKSEDK